MRCDCCGKRRRLLESFAVIEVTNTVDEEGDNGGTHDANNDKRTDDTSRKAVADDTHNEIAVAVTDSTSNTNNASSTDVAGDTSGGTEKLNLCVTCNNLLYKMRDAANAGDEPAFTLVTSQLGTRMRHPSATFTKWKVGYTDILKAKLPQASVCTQSMCQKGLRTF